MADRSVDVLLIGGGVASASAAAELRAQGFAGSVLLVGRELDPPYERPPISKSYFLGKSSKEDAFLAPPPDVEVLTRTSVMKLDTAARVASLSTKETVQYGHALIATGANVRRLPIEGTDLVQALAGAAEEFTDEQIVKIKNGDEFVTAKRVGGVA